MFISYNMKLIKYIHNCILINFKKNNNDNKWDDKKEWKKEEKNKKNVVKNIFPKIIWFLRKMSCLPKRTLT